MMSLTEFNQFIATRLYPGVDYKNKMLSLCLQYLVHLIEEDLDTEEFIKKTWAYQFDLSLDEIQKQYSSRTQIYDHYPEF